MRRALQTINFREEGEKLNIWVAYFNLENEYGNPPEVKKEKECLSSLLISIAAVLTKYINYIQEAVVKTFQRALQYCDPKKLHLSLIGMYERTNQHKLANELLDRMTRRFKSSCKVAAVFDLILLSIFKYIKKKKRKKILY